MRASRDSGGRDGSKPAGGPRRGTPRALVLLGRASPRQSWESDRRVRPAMDDLVGPVAVAPVDRGPQRGVPRDQSVPRLLEGRQVELAAELAGELLDVMPRLGSASVWKSMPAWTGVRG